MADRPTDDDRPDDGSKNTGRRLTVVPNDSAKHEMPPDQLTDAADVDVVFVRRREKRRAALKSRDYPWLRRFIGLGIIVGVFAYGWKTLDSRSEELRRQRARETRMAMRTAPPAGASLGAVETQSGALADATSAGGPPPPTLNQPLGAGPVDFERDEAVLDPKTMTTIGECTKGENAFRALDVGAKAAARGDATLESVFKPTLIEAKGRARRTVSLQNVRIRLKNGEELRLHGSPKTQSGQLYLTLFRVAADGLPEPAEFPEELKDLTDAPLSDEAVNRFLSLSETPGRALEIERHEAWSFTERAGAQLIVSGDQIFDIQVFMRERFLACSRGMKAGVPSVTCQCVERGRE